MRVCVGVLILDAYFSHFPQSQVEYNWVPPALAYNLHSPPVNGKQGPIPEEMFQTLLTNKNQGNFE